MAVITTVVLVHVLTEWVICVGLQAVLEAMIITLVLVLITQETVLVLIEHHVLVLQHVLELMTLQTVVLKLGVLGLLQSLLISHKSQLYHLDTIGYITTLLLVLMLLYSHTQETK